MVFEIKGKKYENVYHPETKTYWLQEVGNPENVIGSSEGGTYTSRTGKKITQEQAQGASLDKPGEATTKLIAVGGSEPTYKTEERMGAEERAKQQVASGLLTAEEVVGGKRLLESKTAQFAEGKRQTLYEQVIFRDKTTKPATEYYPDVKQEIAKAVLSVDIRRKAGLEGTTLIPQQKPYTEPEKQAFYVQDASRVIDKYLYDASADQHFHESGIFSKLFGLEDEIKIKPNMLYRRDIFGGTVEMGYKNTERILTKSRSVSSQEANIMKTLETGALLFSPVGVFTSSSVLAGARVTMPKLNIASLKGIGELPIMKKPYGIELVSPKYSSILAETVKRKAKPKPLQLVQIEKKVTEVKPDIEVIDLSSQIQASFIQPKPKSYTKTLTEARYTGVTQYDIERAKPAVKLMTQAERDVIINKLKQPTKSTSSAELNQRMAVISISKTTQQPMPIQQSISVPVSKSAQKQKQKAPLDVKAVQLQKLKMPSVQVPSTQAPQKQKTQQKQAVKLQLVQDTKIPTPTIPIISLKIPTPLKTPTRLKTPTKPPYRPEYKPPKTPPRKPPRKPPKIPLPDISIGSGIGGMKSIDAQISKSMKIKNPFITLKDI